MNTKEMNKVHARNMFANDIYDTVTDANVSGLITDEEFYLIRKALTKIDPLVGIKY
jgi:hypothetical protein